jgi:hypothetical protein
MGRRRKFKSGGSQSEVTIDKTKKYKWDSKGDFVESTGTPGDNEIVISGSKSSLRRMADIERNIAILATTLTTTDDGVTDSDASSFSSNVNKKTRFKKEVRFDTTINMRDTIDMNGDKITEVGTPTANTDAANKAYVDTAITDLIGGAPGALDTLNELAAAINDDDDYNAAVTTSLGLKVAKTSNQALGTAANAMTISGHTITLARGDSTTDTVTGPDNNDNDNTTYTAGNGLGLSGTVFSMDGQYSGDLTVSGDITAQGGDMTATRFNGEATTAKYADLAERYAADAPYEEGTVVMFGGEAEVTSATGYGSTKIAGVVSTKPAFAMNETAGNSETHPYIALQGRVPCKVIGPVSKGDVLVASEVTGVATVWLDDATDPRMTAYIGIAIEDKASDTAGYVEVKVGK